MRHAVLLTILAGAAGLTAAALAWPLLVAALEACGASWAEAALSPRRLGLLLRGAGVALLACLLAQVLGAMLAAGLVRTGSWTRAVCIWACLAVLLTPPYIFAYAWSLPVWPEGLPTGAALAATGWLSTWGRAAWCLGTWTSPVAAFVLAVGWRRAGQSIHALALFDVGPVRAAWCALPAMAPWLALSATICLLLCLTEYSVCHLCLVQTYNTELLAEVQLLGRAGQGTLLAWPLVALLLPPLAVLWLLRGRLSTALRDVVWGGESESAPAPASGGWAALLVPLLACAALLAPWVMLAAWLRRPEALLSAWRLYPSAWPVALLGALGSALIAGAIAVGADLARAAMRSLTPARVLLAAAAGGALALALLGALVPPALVGDALLAAYLPLAFVSDTWLIVSLAGAARFAVIPVGLVLLSHADRAPLRELALADGADLAARFWRVELPLAAPALLAGMAAVTLLALGEVAATQVVLPVSAGLSVTLLNQIHFGRSDEVIAMCLYLLGVVALASAGLALAGRMPRLR